MTHQYVETVRRFNRFYTQQIGVLHDRLLKSPFSLTEARVLYELAHRDAPTATELGRELGLDASYLSRILRGFAEQGLIARTPSEVDGRQSLLSLTEHGQQVFAPLDAQAQDEIRAILNRMSATDQARFVESIQSIQKLLCGQPEPQPPYSLRSHRPGDMGWIIHRHGLLYAEEYGWDERFEALVAEIAAKFIQEFDPSREHCWIAERAGEIVGSVFLVKQSEDVAKLRLLLVEPKARGLGIGKRLVSECIDFARQRGYVKMILWTNDVLVAARRIYETAGFRLVQEEPHHSFGHDLVGQTWELSL